jgi:glycosyltransferase involved in cell wall biosynthesis
LSAKSKRIAVIIPARNEAESVGRVIAGVRRILPAAEILVVDDGSTDETAAVSAKAGARVVRLPYNLGIGGAVQTGFKYAVGNDFDLALQVDGDGQHPPEEIPRLLKAMVECGADVVVGSRFLGEASFRPGALRLLGIKMFAALVGTICGQRLTDTTSGFRVANRPAMAHLAEMYACDYPEVESLVNLHKAGFRIAETPVRMAPRSGGASSINAARGFYYMLKVCLAVIVDAAAKPVWTRDDIESEQRMKSEERK